MLVLVGQQKLMTYSHIKGNYVWSNVCHWELCGEYLFFILPLQNWVCSGLAKWSSHSKKKVLPSTFFGTSVCQHPEGPNSTKKDHDRNIGVHLDYLVLPATDWSALFVTSWSTVKGAWNYFFLECILNQEVAYASRLDQCWLAGSGSLSA